MSPLRQEAYRERHDQQDGHASERKGACALERHDLFLDDVFSWCRVAPAPALGKRRYCLPRGSSRQASS